MGNSLGGKRSAKVMKINGETVKLKTPVQAGEVVGEYPGHVLLESEAVKHFGVGAKPLEPWQELKPKRLYFLIELPADAAGKRSNENNVPRRVRSGINMSAKDRLESLMLSKRSVSDLSIMRPTTASTVLSEEAERGGAAGAMMRVKMRLPKAEVAKLLMESKDGAEAAEKIVNLCVTNKTAAAAAMAIGGDGAPPPPTGGEGASLRRPGLHWKGGHRRSVNKAREKRVGFLPVGEGEINQLAMAS